MGQKGKGRLPSACWRTSGSPTAQVLPVWVLKVGGAERRLSLPQESTRLMHTDVATTRKSHLEAELSALSVENTPSYL